MFEKKNSIFKLVLAEQYMSFLFCTMKIGDRFPSIKSIADDLELSVGIIQKALSNLESQQSVFLEKKGHQGTFLKNRSLEKLYKINHQNPIFCALPLPYTMRYEGLASSIYELTKNITPCYFMHTRGASLRLDLVISEKADMCLVSRLAFEHIQHKDLEIAYNYGSQSYLEKHVIVLRTGENLESVQTVGLDFNSYDQQFLTENVFKKSQISLKDINYHILMNKLINKEIDATILNLDEDRVKAFQILEIDPQFYPSSLTEAVLIVRKDDLKIKKIISALWERQIIDQFMTKLL